MNLQVDGTIIDVMPPVNGISKNGKQWQKQEFVVETAEQYPRKICFSLFGGKVEGMSHLIQVNNSVRVYFDVESHEYNGRWFTNINAYSIEPATGQAEGQSQSAMPLSPMEKAGLGFSNQQPEPQPEIPPLTDTVSPDPDDDFPF